MTKIQPLSVLLSIIYNSYSSNMIHYFSSLCVEQVISTVIAPVTEVNIKQVRFCLKNILVLYVTNCANNLCINLKRVQLGYMPCWLKKKPTQHTGRENPPKVGIHKSSWFTLHLAPKLTLISQK